MSPASIAKLVAGRTTGRWVTRWISLARQGAAIMGQFAALLRHHRTRLGLTRKALADLIGKSANYIAVLEDPHASPGDAKTPSVETLRLLIEQLARPSLSPDSKSSTLNQRIAIEIAWAAV